MPDILTNDAHVIQVINTLEPAGAERVAVDLALASCAAERKTSVFSLHGGPLQAVLEDAGIPIHLGAADENILGAVMRLARLTKEHPTVIVHSHLIRSNLIARTASLIARPTALIETQHDTYKRPLWASAYRYATRARVSATVACSPRVADYVNTVMRVPQGRLQIIENGVDTQTYSQGAGPWHRPPVVGSIGSLLEVKRYDVLLKAFAEILKHDRPVKLILFGEGAARTLLQTLIEELGIAHAVSMPGVALDVPAALRELDVFVQPHVRSSVGMSIMEAMAAAKPVIIGVDEGFILAPAAPTAALFESGDVAELSSCLGELLLHPEKARQVGELSQDWVRSERTSKAAAARYLDLYDELTRKSARRSRPQES